MSEPIAWQPDEQTRRRARLTAFMEQCGANHYEDLQKRSTEDPAWFTEQLLKFLKIQFDPPYRTVLDLSHGLEWAQWCVGGGLNITEECLRLGSPRTTAVVWEGEEGATRAWSYLALKAKVAHCAAGLRTLGLGKGDAIGIHLPMVPETVVVMLAVGRIGAVAVPLFSGYGPSAIETRLNDVGAKALITCDAFPRRGKVVKAKATADEAAARCPSLQRVVVVPRMGIEAPMTEGRDITWDELMSLGGDGSPEATDAEDALIIIYTSGTTGKPKGIRHTHCSFPVKAAQDVALNFDVGAETRICWVTDIGWMMGPWLIYGTLLNGGTICLYDGAPDYPTPDRLWAFASRHFVEVLGLAPTLVRALATQGDEWATRQPVTRLRIFGSTGEAWNPAPWWWLFEKVGRGKIPILNYSGGTEVAGGILGSNPLLPVKPCGFSAPCLGIAADVFSDKGTPVKHAVGELVIKGPWIGMARGFHNDPQRYLDTYWSRWPGIWAHGDWAQVDEDGHWFILGRSDDTLKIAGKRVGPAEVESILVGHPSVSEAAVIGVPDELKGSAMVAMVVSPEASTELAGQLSDLIAAELGKPLRPERVVFVDALPRTRNAKVMRRVIRAAWLGEDAGDTTALENPAAVEQIRRAANAGEL